MANLNRFDLEMFAKRAAQDLVTNGRDLDESILDISSKNNLTREQVKRVVESANTFANGEIVKMAKEQGQDPRVSFRLADSHNIFSRMIESSDGAKVASTIQAEKLASMFVVQPKRQSTEGLDKTAETFQKQAKISELDGYELASAYITGNVPGDQVFTVGQVSDALNELHLVKQSSQLYFSRIDEARSEIMSKLAKSIEDELHKGLTPATIKHAIKLTDVCEFEIKEACQIVDNLANEMMIREGTSQIKQASIVDNSSDIAIGMFSLLLLDAEKQKAFDAAGKVASVIERASADFNKIRESDGQEKTAFNIASTAIGKKVIGKFGPVGGALGPGFAAYDAAGKAGQATKRLKQMQMTPAVGPMKMAAEKLAFIDFKNLNPNPAQIGGLLVASAALAAGSSLAVKGVNYVSQRVSNVFEINKRNKIFENLVKREPSIKDNPKAREYFDLILTYAPALGDHPLAIGDFLKRQLQYPVSGIEFLDALAKFQKTVVESRAQGSSMLHENLQSTSNQISKNWVENI